MRVQGFSDVQVAGLWLCVCDWAGSSSLEFRV